jgi:hypothetical protein
LVCLFIYLLSLLFLAALQRVIPHDHRIDYIPSAAIRDRMIIFQDYYNIDDCFEFLTLNTVFKGGDVRDSRNWVVDPKYSMKYWFICHQLVEQTYDDCINDEGVDHINKVYMEWNRSKVGDIGNTNSQRQQNGPIMMDTELN